MQNEAKQTAEKKCAATVRNELAVSAFDVRLLCCERGLHVCIVQTDRQSVIRDAVSLLCCCRDGSVGFCYGYDCVLPQTKIKSARGFYQFNAE